MDRTFQCGHFDILFVKFGPVDLLELNKQVGVICFLVLFGIKILCTLAERFGAPG